MSISQVFLKGRNRYKIDNEVVVKFCFPTLGVAVPLWPGDFLLFNSLIPHYILSQCKLDNNIMCVLMYLKLAAVGMNNNSLSLTSEKEVLAIRYQPVFPSSLILPSSMLYKNSIIIWLICRTVNHYYLNYNVFVLECCLGEAGRTKLITDSKGSRCLWLTRVYFKSDMIWRFCHQRNNFSFALVIQIRTYPHL